ncbi:MFS monocarboxylate [Apiospora rasikravindrae]|uniref:MFS monocarboxylate n=1 Tax=Apiospora rasikravindrae TaxID=990691 RepID=A0ABR1S2R5_9PEZI
MAALADVACLLAEGGGERQREQKGHGAQGLIRRRWHSVRTGPGIMSGLVSQGVRVPDPDEAPRFRHEVVPALAALLDVPKAEYVTGQPIDDISDRLIDVEVFGVKPQHFYRSGNTVMQRWKELSTVLVDAIGKNQRGRRPYDKWTARATAVVLEFLGMGWVRMPEGVHPFNALQLALKHAPRYSGAGKGGWPETALVLAAVKIELNSYLRHLTDTEPINPARARPRLTSSRRRPSRPPTPPPDEEQGTVNIARGGEHELAPVDGGAAAWKLLCAAFVLQASLWGFLPPSLRCLPQYYITKVPDFACSNPSVSVLGARVVMSLVQQQRFQRWRRPMLWAGCMVNEYRIVAPRHGTRRAVRCVGTLGGATTPFLAARAAGTDSPLLAGPIVPLLKGPLTAITGGHCPKFNGALAKIPAVLDSLGREPASGARRLLPGTISTILRNRRRAATIEAAHFSSSCVSASAGFMPLWAHMSNADVNDGTAAPMVSGLLNSAREWGACGPGPSVGFRREDYSTASPYRWVIMFAGVHVRQCLHCLLAVSQAHHHLGFLDRERQLDEQQWHMGLGGLLFSIPNAA